MMEDKSADISKAVETWTGKRVCDLKPVYMSGNVKLTEQIREHVNWGNLYNWYAANSVKNISSSAAWAVPTQDQCDSLKTFLGVGSAYKMRQIGYDTWDYVLDSMNGQNTVGMNVKSSPFRTAGTGVYSAIGLYSHVWYSTQGDATHGGWMNLWGNDGELLVSTPWASKFYGHVVWLIRTGTLLKNGETGIYVGNDGREYDTVCVNGIEWMAENLAESKYRDGSAIPVIVLDADWAALVAGQDAMCGHPTTAKILNPAYTNMKSVTDLGFDGINYYAGSLRINVNSAIRKKRVDGDNVADLAASYMAIGLAVFCNEKNSFRSDETNDEYILTHEPAAMSIYPNNVTNYDEKNFFVNMFLEDVVFQQVGIALRMQYYFTNPDFVKNTDNFSWQFNGYKVLFE